MSVRQAVSLAVTAALALSAAAPAQGQEAAPAAAPRAAITPSVSPAPPTVVRRAPPRPAPVARRIQPQALPAAAPAAKAAADLDLTAFVDGAVQQAMAREHVAGVAVTVVQNGQVLLKKGYGAAALSADAAGPERAMDPDRTLLRLGQITSTLTAIAALKEIEAGHMRLDAPINLYLPERLQIADQGFKQPILVRHLLTHTAGFEDRILGQLFERSPQRIRPLDVYLRQERPRRVREPGVAAAYSDYGIALLGAATANVVGKPMEQWIDETILRPARLFDTTLREPRDAINGLPQPLPAAMAARVSQGFDWRAGAFTLSPYAYAGQAAPALAGSATAADMARFMTLLLAGGSVDGVQVFGPRTAQSLRQPLFSPAPGVTQWTAGLQSGVAAGGKGALGLQGQTLSFTSKMTLVPEQNLGVFASVNTRTGAALPGELTDLILRRFAGGAPAPQGVAADLAPAAGLFDGLYVSNKRAVGSLEGFLDRLTATAKVGVDAAGRRLVTVIDGRTRTWTPLADGATFQATDGPERLVFQGGETRMDRFYPPGGEAVYLRAGPLEQPRLLAILAALTLLASLAALGGMALRSRREMRETSIQRRANLMQTTQAVLWLSAMGCFAAWALRSRDAAAMFFSWPSPLVTIASALSLVAGLLAIATLLVTPAIWRGGRRVDSWTGGRKLGFTYTALLFCAFTILLAYWGALAPWSA